MYEASVVSALPLAEANSAPHSNVKSRLRKMAKMDRRTSPGRRCIDKLYVKVRLLYFFQERRQ
jgi:hypothetical protein